MPRIIRKPVPQISTCLKCGHDFKYMRTLMIKLHCKPCNSIRKKAEREARLARQEKRP